MIKCPTCNSDYVDCNLRDILDPANDLFTCLSCGEKFLRYQQTKYETTEEKIRRLHKNANQR